MDDNFAACLTFVRKWEGGLSDHAKDSGGRTKFGVSDLADGVRDGMIDLDRDGIPDVRVDDLTVAQAEEFYERWYWRPINGDELPRGIDLCVFDFGVNSGVKRSASYLQRVLGVPEDGVIGVRTLTALRTRHGVERSYANVVNAFCAQRERFYRTVKHRETGELLFPTFGAGWLNRLADCRLRALAMIA